MMAVLTMGEKLALPTLELARKASLNIKKILKRIRKN
jgi:hypothetical protein